MNVNDKRAQICKLEFADIDYAVVSSEPSSPYIQISADWFDIPISSAEFSEGTDQNNLVKQELKGIVTNTGNITRAELTEKLANYGLLRMTYTNGEQRVLGSAQFPVAVTLEENGSPARLELTVSHESATRAKKFQSF